MNRLCVNNLGADQSAKFCEFSQTNSWVYGYEQRSYHKPTAMTSDDAEAAKLLAWLILEVLSNQVQWNAHFSLQI